MSSKYWQRLVAWDFNKSKLTGWQQIINFALGSWLFNLLCLLVQLLSLFCPFLHMCCKFPPTIYWLSYPRTSAYEEPYHLATLKSQMSIKRWYLEQLFISIYQIPKSWLTLNLNSYKVKCKERAFLEKHIIGNNVVFNQN